jgi:N-acetylglutamate synthase
MSAAGAAAPPLIWRVEQTTVNAWPALHEILLGAWVLRFGGGVSRRANSANPLRPDASGDDTLIAACEARYRRCGLPAIFRIPSFLDPAFDALLAAHGYTAEGETLTLYGAIDQIAAAADPAVTLDPHPTVGWLAAMAALQAQGAEQAAAYRRIVGRIAVPAAFGALTIDGAPAALAYGVMHDGLLCYESVVTDPMRRRRGYARRVIASLAAWAKEASAAGACLQVAADNAPALPLYRSFGLTTELYRYLYRRAPA